MFISVVTINFLVRRLEWASKKDDLCPLFSLQSTPSYVYWNWASRKDDLCLFLLLQSTPLYVGWN